MRLMRFGQQVVAVAENGRLGRDTLPCRRAAGPGPDAVVAEDALAHVGDRRRPSRSAGCRRAGHHAVAAAHALVAVIDHRARGWSCAERPPGRPKRRPVPGSGGTACAQTRARGLRQWKSSSCAESPSSRSQRRGRSGAQMILLLAGDHALAAADALGGVGEDGRLSFGADLAIHGAGASLQPGSCIQVGRSA